MEAYVKYLRSPYSKPLTIAQYNEEKSQMLDPSPAFEHLCLEAWRKGRAANNHDPSEHIRTPFPSLEAKADSNVIQFQFQNFSKQVPITPENVEKLRRSWTVTARPWWRHARRICAAREDLEATLSSVEAGSNGPHVVDNRD